MPAILANSKQSEHSRFEAGSPPSLVKNDTAVTQPRSIALSLQTDPKNNESETSNESREAPNQVERLYAVNESLRLEN